MVNGDLRRRLIPQRLQAKTQETRLNGLPKGTSSGGHEKDWLISVLGKVVENSLTLSQRDVSVDPLERDVLPSQMVVNEIQGPCPTRENDTRESWISNV